MSGPYRDPTANELAEHIRELTAERDALLSALDDIVTASALPGDHCELDDAIKAARMLLEVSNER